MWKDVNAKTLVFLNYDKSIMIRHWGKTGMEPESHPFWKGTSSSKPSFLRCRVSFWGCTPTYSPTCRAVYRSLLNSHCPSGWIFSAILMSPVVCASERLRSTVSLYWEQYASDRFQISMLPAWRCLDDSTISVSVCQKKPMKNTKLRRHCFFQRNHWLVYPPWNKKIAPENWRLDDEAMSVLGSVWISHFSSSRTSPKPPSRNGCFSRIAGPWNHGLPCRWYNPSLSGRRLEIYLRQDLSDRETRRESSQLNRQTSGRRFFSARSKKRQEGLLHGKLSQIAFDPPQIIAKCSNHVAGNILLCPHLVVLERSFYIFHYMRSES